MAAVVETGLYLKFGATPRENARPVLWPVLVHRVLYPDARLPELNLFQRAVLGLIRARTVRVETIAELTGLHLNLIKLILAQGVSNGWLAENAEALTHKGERLLDNEEVDEANLKSGFVLQDAVTGHCWPRLVSQLAQIEPIDPLARHPEFLNERKTGKAIKPFMITGDRGDLPPFDHDTLMTAYREYRQDYRASQQLGHVSQGAQIRLQGVQRLDDMPLTAWVLLWVVADREGDGLWSVRDPFGLRTNAWWLQDPLRQVIERDANLLKRLEPLVEIPRADNQSVEEWLASLSKQTDLRILIEYPWIEHQPDIKRYMAALLVRKEKLLQGDCSEHELAAAVTESQQLLEVVMQWLIYTYPADVGQLPKQQRHDWRLNQRILSALQIPAFNKDVIQQLARQRIDQVIRACNRPKDSLKALLFAAAMGTLSAPQHPLKVLSDEELQLEELLALADMRNSKAHAESGFTGKGVTQLSKRDALEKIRYALGFTARFKGWM